MPDPRKAPKWIMRLLNPRRILICVAMAAWIGEFCPIEGKKPPPPTRDQLAKMPSGELAGAYMELEYTLALVKWGAAGSAFGGASNIHVIIDGEPVTIPKKDFGRFQAQLEARETIYTEAIEQRGFRQIGGEYVPTFAPGCELGFSPAKEVTIAQEGFKIKFLEGLYTGVVVESALHADNAWNSAIHLTGTIDPGRIALKDDRSGCLVTLSAK